jgi:alpha-glucosidase (family GH31 glycosyl hydrolase)
VRTRIDLEYSGKFWPGDSVWVEFLNKWPRICWESLFDFKNYHQSTLSLYVWNGKNEPSVINVSDHPIQKDILYLSSY